MTEEEFIDAARIQTIGLRDHRGLIYSKWIRRTKSGSRKATSDKRQRNALEEAGLQLLVARYD